MCVLDSDLVSEWNWLFSGYFDVWILCFGWNKTGQSRGYIGQKQCWCWKMAMGVCRQLQAVLGFWRENEHLQRSMAVRKFPAVCCCVSMLNLFCVEVCIQLSYAVADLPLHKATTDESRNNEPQTHIRDPFAWRSVFLLPVPRGPSMQTCSIMNVICTSYSDCSYNSLYCKSRCPKIGCNPPILL